MVPVGTRGYSTTRFESSALVSKSFVRLVHAEPPFAALSVTVQKLIIGKLKLITYNGAPEKVDNNANKAIEI